MSNLSTLSPWNGEDPTQPERDDITQEFSLEEIFKVHGHVYSPSGDSLPIIEHTNSQVTTIISSEALQEIAAAREESSDIQDRAIQTAKALESSDIQAPSETVLMRYIYQSFTFVLTPISVDLIPLSNKDNSWFIPSIDIKTIDFVYALARAFEAIPSATKHDLGFYKPEDRDDVAQAILYKTRNPKLLLSPWVLDRCKKLSWSPEYLKAFVRMLKEETCSWEKTSPEILQEQLKKILSDIFETGNFWGESNITLNKIISIPLASFQQVITVAYNAFQKNHPEYPQINLQYLFMQDGEHGIDEQQYAAVLFWLEEKESITEITKNLNHFLPKNTKWFDSSVFIERGVKKFFDVFLRQNAGNFFTPKAPSPQDQDDMNALLDGTHEMDVVFEKMRTDPSFNAAGILTKQTETSFVELISKNPEYIVTGQYNDPKTHDVRMHFDNIRDDLKQQDADIALSLTEGNVHTSVCIRWKNVNHHLLEVSSPSFITSRFCIYHLRMRGLVYMINKTDGDIHMYAWVDSIHMTDCSHVYFLYDAKDAITDEISRRKLIIPQQGDIIDIDNIQSTYEL